MTARRRADARPHMPRWRYTPLLPSVECQAWRRSGYGEPLLPREKGHMSRSQCLMPTEPFCWAEATPTNTSRHRTLLTCRAPVRCREVPYCVVYRGARMSESQHGCDLCAHSRTRRTPCRCISPRNLCERFSFIEARPQDFACVDRIADADRTSRVTLSLLYNHTSTPTR